MQQIKRKMKREIKANGLTHKLPLTHEAQFSCTTQEECNLTFRFLTRELRACNFRLLRPFDSFFASNKQTKWRPLLPRIVGR